MDQLYFSSFILNILEDLIIILKIKSELEILILMVSNKPQKHYKMS